MNKFFSDVVKGFAFAIGFSLWMFGASYGYSIYIEKKYNFSELSQFTHADCPSSKTPTTKEETLQHENRKYMLQFEERTAEIFKRTLQRISELEKQVEAQK